MIRVIDAEHECYTNLISQSKLSVFTTRYIAAMIAIKGFTDAKGTINGSCCTPKSVPVNC